MALSKHCLEYQGDLTLQIILYVIHNKCCFTYLNKILSQKTKGVRISEDALYFLLEQLRVLEIFIEVHCTHMYCQTQAYHYQVASG